MLATFSLIAVDQSITIFYLIYFLIVSEIKRLNLQLHDSSSEEKSTIEGLKTEKENLSKEIDVLAKELEEVKKTNKDLTDKLEKINRDTEFDKKLVKKLAFKVK